MAKRKHSAALFEVYHDKESKPARPRSPRFSAWWSKGRSAVSAPESVQEKQVVDENDPTTMSIRSPLIAPRLVTAGETEQPEQLAIIAPSARKETAVLGDSTPAPTVDRAASGSIFEFLPKAWVERFHIDPASREVSMRLPFTTAIIAVSVVFVFVAGAYIVGRHSAESQIALLASELADQRKATADLRPSALDLPRRAARPTAAPITARPAPRVVVDEDSHPHESAPVANSVHGIDPVPASAHTPADADLPRTIGLNYICLQSCASEATAESVRTFFETNGVACTVEAVPTKVAYAGDANWRAVITTRGFARDQLHSPEYKDFMHLIATLETKLANGRSSPFQPQAFKLE